MEQVTKYLSFIAKNKKNWIKKDYTFKNKKFKKKKMENSYTKYIENQMITLKEDNILKDATVNFQLIKNNYNNWELQINEFINGEFIFELHHPNFTIRQIREIKEHLYLVIKKVHFTQGEVYGVYKRNVAITYEIKSLDNKITNEYYESIKPQRKGNN